MLEQCLDSDVCMAHLIDEVMIFDKELQSIVLNPEINCINVFLEDPYLGYWIDLEKKRMYINIYSPWNRLQPSEIRLIFVNLMLVDS